MADKRIRDIAGESRIHQEDAAQRAHGAHGKGQREQAEERVDEAAPLPGNSGHKGDVHLSEAGWGSAASGGSVIDKRPPENKRANKG